MSEYTVHFLNGITREIMAFDWKDAIIEAKHHAERMGFACKEIKTIYDVDGEAINNINLKTLEYSHKICGIQEAITQ